MWGSPGSGKTTVAVRLAKYLADKRRNVILLLCDMTAPMLPCICPAADLECERSLGSVLAAAHVSENLVKNNLVTHKRLGYLTMLGMLKGENEYTYPPYNEVQARELIDCLREIAPYVVIDCGSYIANDILSAVALMEADSACGWPTPTSRASATCPANFPSCGMPNGIRTSSTRPPAM